MHVRILEEKLSSLDSAGNLHTLVKGDVATVPDDTGAYWVGEKGWAEDMDGNVATAERKVIRGQTLNVKSMKHEAGPRKAGGSKKGGK